MSIPQAIVSSPAARQGIQKGELTCCCVNPPGERQETGSAAGDSEVGTYSLSCQSPRRASATQQRGRGFRKGSHSVMSIPQAIVSSPTARQGIQQGSSPAIMSIPQVSVSKPAARQGIWKGQLTCCHVDPPGERQFTGSAARDPEGGAHRLSCQSPGERQQAGSAARDSEGGAHRLSCQSPGER